MSDVRSQSSTLKRPGAAPENTAGPADRSVAEHLVSLLQSHGIRHVFGVPSGDWLPYLEAMANTDVEFVLVANEASAGFMAVVYGWLAGVPGACYGTRGPGATNLSTGVGSAFLDRSPVLAFTSEPSDELLGRTSQMVVDHQALFRPLTKLTMRLDPEIMDRQFSRAIAVANAELPGPVHIGLPGGAGDTTVPASSPEPYQRTDPGQPSEDGIRSMLNRLEEAHKPILAVGLSAVRRDMGELIAQVAERHGIPVVLTPMAKGLLSEDHPWYAGVLMHALSDQVALTHSQADLVVGVGYDPVEFNYEEWMPEVPLVHLDSVPADIDRKVYPDVLNVTGNPKTSLTRLCEELSADFAWDLESIRERRDAMLARFVPAAGSFGPFAAIHLLRELLPESGIMTCDVGAHTHLIGQAWRTPHRFAQLMTNGWSSMGFGVPAAIAAKIARPDVPVVCVTGDGGFMMMAGEMTTALRMQLPVVFVVLVDRELSLIRIKQDKRGNSHAGTHLSGPNEPRSDFIFGVPVVRCASQEEYRAALSEALQADGPVVVEAEVSISEYESTILKKHR